MTEKEFLPIGILIDLGALALIGSANLHLGIIGMLLMYAVASTCSRLPA